MRQRQDANPNVHESGWCCREGLNLRPPPYQGGALPLSYGSAGPEAKTARMERGRERADPCHKGENGASARRRMADQCAKGPSVEHRRFLILSHERWFQGRRPDAATAAFERGTAGES